MKQFTTSFEEAVFPVIDYRRCVRYIDGKRTDMLDSRYTILHGYDQVEITIADDGKDVTPQQIKAEADQGTPLSMIFQSLVITIRPKSEYEIRAIGSAAKATLIDTKGK